MNRKQLCALFARRSAKKGRASNLYFEGRVMFSYGEHFPLAVILDGNRAAVNEDSYSKSTSVHTGAVRFALDQAGYKLEHFSTKDMKDIAYEWRNKE